MADKRITSLTNYTTYPIAGTYAFHIANPLGSDYYVTYNNLSKSILSNKTIGGSAVGDITTGNNTQTLTNKTINSCELGSCTLTGPTIQNPAASDGTYLRPVITSGSWTNGSLTVPTINGFSIANANGTEIDQCSGLSGNIQTQLDGKLGPVGGGGKKHTVIPYYTSSFTGVTSKNFLGSTILTELGYSPSSYFICADQGIFVQAYTRGGSAGSYEYTKDTTIGVKIRTTTNSVLSGTDQIVTTCSVTGLSSPTTYRISMLVSVKSYL